MVIAEPGGTHEGRYIEIIALIDAAVRAGADVFKNQWCSDPDLLCARRHAPEYRVAYEYLHYPLAWHEAFAHMCQARGIQYACTSYLPKDVWQVDPYVSIHKIAAFEANDRALVRTAMATGKRVIVSAGMGHTVDWSGVDWLACTSAYPAPLDAMCLRRLGQTGMGRCVGLSDHSRNVLTGAVAVGAGASIIETHMRLHDCSPANPDYPVAFNPDEFAQYVANIRIAETLMGEADPGLQACEEPMVKYRVTA